MDKIKRYFPTWAIILGLCGVGALAIAAYPSNGVIVLRCGYSTARGFFCYDTDGNVKKSDSDTTGATAPAIVSSDHFGGAGGCAWDGGCTAPSPNPSPMTNAQSVALPSGQKHTDTAWTVSGQFANSTSAHGSIFDVKFGTPFATVPHCAITAQDKNASDVRPYFFSGTTTDVVVGSSTAPDGGANFKISGICVQ